MRTASWALLAAAVVTTAAIAAAPPTDTTPAAFDVQHSSMTVHVYKQGLFAFAADDHEIDAPITSGFYDAARGSVEVSVEASAMKVLDPKLAPGRRATVQSNMSGSQVLDVGKYPTITFRSTKLEIGAPGHLSVKGDLTLHGQTHAIVVDVVEVDATHFTGEAAVRQTDFGISPIKIAGGTVRVKDNVKVVFDIALL